MSNLFIVGNGFDLAHEMKTSYENFHEYLKSEYPDANGDELLIPSATYNQDGGVEYDDKEVVSFLMYIISNAEKAGEYWGDLESSLGYLDYDYAFDDIEEVLDKDGDSDDFKNLYNNEDMANILVTPVQSIKTYFTDWIDTIKINMYILRKYSFERLINRDLDLFLTFNYTKTLEVLYGVKNVCHIHGAQGGEILLGHGRDDEHDQQNDDLEDDYDYYNDDYDDGNDEPIGAGYVLQELHNSLRKDTKKAIKVHQDFFGNLSSSINSIFSIGFSFSEVDEIYISEICNKLSTENITWYLNDFNKGDERKKYQDIIKKCGFRGKYGIFHI